MKTLPTKDDDILIHPAFWVNKHGKEVTVETLLSSTNARTDILMALLERVRASIRKVAFVERGRTPASKHMLEHRIREEVHNMPLKFNFAMDALREFHPVHRAEMIVILLSMLQHQGVDAKSYTTMLGRSTKQ